MAKELKEEKPMEVEKAKKLLEEENQKLLQTCQKEVNAVLEKYGCALVVAMLVTPQGNIPQVSIGFVETT